MNPKLNHYWQTYKTLPLANSLSPVLVLIAALMILTPLCGWLFSCGCTWPWLGLDAKCNYYQSHAVHQCPWCVSKWVGWSSVGLSLAVGVIVAAYPWIKPQRNGLYSFLWGLLAFVAMAILTGQLAALMLAYPL
jgi:hypothetical protein